MFTVVQAFCKRKPNFEPDYNYTFKRFEADTLKEAMSQYHNNLQYFDCAKYHNMGIYDVINSDESK